MKLRSLLGAANRKMLCSVYRRMVPLGNRGPIVSFGFDDFPRSAYLVAGRILESFGGRGTYYVAPNLMDTRDGLGELCIAEDLRALLEAGHELGTQTFHHLSSRKVSPQAFRRDVEQGILAAEQMAGRRVKSFAYPYGHATLRTKKHLEPVVSSARSVIPGINGPEIDLNLLLANPLYADMSGAPRAQRLIEQNVRQKGWLIFFTHDVRPNPSRYGCTPELFKFAVSATAQSGSRILTVEQVLAELSTSKGLARQTHDDVARTVLGAGKSLENGELEGADQAVSRSH
jgi:peptidoglycan/xylan/chitin deacetylase (PgdA/CDA1 family)